MRRLLAIIYTEKLLIMIHFEVAYNYHGQNKYLQQKQKPHVKIKNPTAKTKALKKVKPKTSQRKNLGESNAKIDLFTVFDAILTSRQTFEKLQCLYENLMSNNFRRTGEQNINCKLKLQSKGLS